MHKHGHLQLKGSAERPIVVNDDEDGDVHDIMVISSDSEPDIVLLSPNNKKRRSSPPSGPQSKRPRLVDERVSEPYYNEILDSSEEEDASYGIYDIPHVSQILDVEKWKLPTLGPRRHRLRKVGERILEPSCRPEPHRLGQNIMMRGYFLQNLSSLSPYVHFHQSRIQQRIKSSLDHAGLSESTQYHLKRHSQVHRARVGGCPNVIVQNGQFVAIGAAVHGVDGNTFSAANQNGLVIMSSKTKNSLPMMSQGHASARSRSRGRHRTENSNESRDWDSPIDPNNLIFKSVFDVQFDPGCPTRLLSAGEDNRIYVWGIEENEDGEYRVRSSDNAAKRSKRERFHAFASRPHFIQFNPNQQHWKEDEDELSTYLVSDGKGNFALGYPGWRHDIYSVDPRQNRQVSSICWGHGPTQDMIFAGTETIDYTNAEVEGCQKAYRVLADGTAHQVLYTNSSQEVDQLALNPQGNLLASFTRTCDASTVSCWGCDRRDISSRQELSLYSVSGLSGHPNTPETSSKSFRNSAFIDRVTLPPFRTSDCFNESGIVVSASWSPCGTYIAAARDDDWIDIFDHRFLRPSPVMRLSHATPPKQTLRKALSRNGDESQCCQVVEKHPKHGVTGLAWTRGTGYFGGLNLLTGGSDGCVRLWDIRQSGISTIVQQLETAIAAINLGDLSNNEVPLVVADEDGLLEMCMFKGGATQAL